MLVYRFDRTFEGLLTALFDAYDRKIFPDRLITEREPLPMFTEEEYVVITDTEKSNRVWRGLQKKLDKEVCSMLMHVWLSEEFGCEELLFRYMRKVFDVSHSVVTDFSDDDVLQVKKIAYKVARERLFLLQFVRFQKAADDIFFASVSPQYNALPLAIRHFTDRFADQKWVIYDITRNYGYYYDLKTVIEVTLDSGEHLLSGKLDESLMAEDEKLFQQLWKNYFNALTIKERINPRLQRQHMPRRFWKYLTEKQ